MRGIKIEGNGGNLKQKMGYKEYNEYDKFVKDKYNKNNFRVRSPIKTFRDLEVYQVTINLSNLLLGLDFLDEERNEIKKISESIPRLIAESYGDKFDSMETAEKKLDEAITLIAGIITKLDILREKFLEEKENKENLDKLILKYNSQRRKVLNLKKAWKRVFGKPSEVKNESGK